MTATEMWTQFLRNNQNINAGFSAWSFGENSDELADLVVQGIKTATSSAYIWYELESQPLPQIGDYSVICDGRDQARCIIQTTAVTIVPFDEVSEEHAFKEGEQDRRLDTWRTIHEAFFRAEFAPAKLIFHPQIKVVCEEFQVVYIPNSTM